MVMAGNESTVTPFTEESISARLQLLRQRREALQEKLAQKNNELKNLCVEEAQLTGTLPPETPLEPGETPPTFRRRVGTSFTYPQNLINKTKTTELEESSLELERQVQIGIVEAALAIVNDPAQSKAVRRKHRLVYQQSQRRLQELEARLSFVRQARNKTRQPQLQHTVPCNTQVHLHTNVRPRTKKPRPPLESKGRLSQWSDGSVKSTRSVSQESGLSLKVLSPEQKCNTYPGHNYEEQLTIPNILNHNRNPYNATSPVDQGQNIKIIEHDHNENHNIYILPDQYRVRTYSYGSGGMRSQYTPETERTYRPVPNTYTEEERQIRLRQFQQQQQQQLHHHHHHYQQQQQYHELMHNHQQYPEYKRLENDIQRKSAQAFYDKDFPRPYYTQGPDYQVFCKNSTQSQTALRTDCDSPGSANLKNTDLSGHWMRYNDEIVWCPDDQPIHDRFGSLDRRKRNTVLGHTGGINPETQSRYHTVVIGGSKNSSAVPRQHHPSNHALPLNEQVSPNGRILLRTQSLGSVETWHSGHSYDLQDGRDGTENQNSRKGKEKEWYETSVDSGTSPGLDLSLGSPRRSTHCQPSPSFPMHHKKEVKPLDIGKDSYSSPTLLHRIPQEPPPEDRHLKPIQNRYDLNRQRVLEIPAETKPSQPVEEPIQLGSPTSTSQNCTIVQAGKYQPYREITKPFEMSDFYKYSTKFRKKNEAAAQATANGNQRDPRHSEIPGSSETSADNASATFTDNGPVNNAVQKRIYQPVQRMTCQPYRSTLR